MQARCSYTSQRSPGNEHLWAGCRSDPQVPGRWRQPCQLPDPPCSTHRTGTLYIMHPRIPGRYAGFDAQLVRALSGSIPLIRHDETLG
jgi:hypothetical protein